MKAIALIVLSVALAACSGAEQKPERKWDVKVTKQGESRVWVFREDGSIQCEENSAKITLAGATQELKKAGIMVYQGRTGHDGLMRTAVCGAGTGSTVELEIAKSDLPKAVAKGYQAKQAN